MTPGGRERACPAIAVPAGMADVVAGYRWRRDTVGESGGAVYRLHGKPGAPDLYLKHGGDEVGDEAARLRWLAGRVAVPTVVRFASGAGGSWLLTEALVGRTAWQCLADRSSEALAVADALADFLRHLHSLPIEGCPFDSGHRVRLDAARARLVAGLVDIDDFDEERHGMTAEAVWREMTALLPLSVEAVLTHGDFSLDNLVMEGGKVVGCIDVGRAGVADRYQDAAVMWNCLGEFGEALQRRFLERYGIADVDERRLRFHLMLDEFF